MFEYARARFGALFCVECTHVISETFDVRVSIRLHLGRSKDDEGVRNSQRLRDVVTHVAALWHGSMDAVSGLFRACAAMLKASGLCHDDTRAAPKYAFESGGAKWAEWLHILIAFMREKLVAPCIDPNGRLRDACPTAVTFWSLRAFFEFVSLGPWRGLSFHPVFSLCLRAKPSPGPELCVESSWRGRMLFGRRSRDESQWRRNAAVCGLLHEGAPGDAVWLAAMLATLPQGGGEPLNIRSMLRTLVACN